MNSVYTCTGLVFKTFSKSSLGTPAPIDYQELSKQMAQENTVIQESAIIFNAVTYIDSLHTTYIVLFRYYLHCVVLFYLQSIVTLLHLHT